MVDDSQREFYEQYLTLTRTLSIFRNSQIIIINSNDQKHGVLVDDLSQQGYQKSITMLQSNKHDPTQVRRIAKQHFSLEKGIEAYHDIYKQLVGNQNS